MTSCWPQGSAAAAAAGQQRDVDLVPKLECHDGANNYVLRLDLPGFKKEEFQVLVDPSGWVTIRGQRPAGHVRVHRKFQLPPTADLDKIAARFDGSVLHLTVPKLPVGAAEMVRTRMAEAKVVAEWEMEMEKERSKWDNGQVFTAVVAAFALGAIVSHRLFSARNS